jgi:hypothetical protein
MLQIYCACNCRFTTVLLVQAYAAVREVPLVQLTLSQLHQLADTWPEAKGSNDWIAAVVLKMHSQQPAGQAPLAQRRAFLDRVQDFCDSLPLEVATPFYRVSTHSAVPLIPHDVIHRGMAMRRIWVMTVVRFFLL